MTLFSHPRKGVVKASDTLAGFLAKRGFKPVDAPADTAELKGQALDAALRAADLPLTGSADEKRERLEEHRAALLDVIDDELDDDTDPSQGQ